MRRHNSTKDQGDLLLSTVRDINKITSEEEKNESMMNNHVLYQVSQAFVSAVINCSNDMGWQCNEEASVNMH